MDKKLSKKQILKTLYEFNKNNPSDYLTYDSAKGEFVKVDKKPVISSSLKKYLEG